MARTTKPVFIVGTGQTFPSASAAAKALGINPGNLYSVLAGRRKTAGGYKFGYAANRAVSVSKNGETKIYSSVEAAAKAVHANVSKVDRLVSGGINKTVKGYEFSYVDASRVYSGANVVSSSVAAPAPKPKNRKSNKTAQIKAHRAKKQQKQQRTAEREAKRQAERDERAEAQRKEQKERAEYRKTKKELAKFGESYFNYSKARSNLQIYMNKVNEQIDKYIEINPALLYYNQATPAVMGLQMYTGYETGAYDITYFDEDLKKFDFPEDLSELSADDLQKMADTMDLLKQRMQAEAEQKGRSFFDVELAEKNRTALAFEFYKNTGHENDMDEYAYMIWDILDIIQRANEYEDLGSEIVFRTISDAMQGGVDHNTLETFIGHIDNWMSSGGDQDELDEILSELDGTYDAPRGFSVFDDDWGWTT